MKEIYHQIKDFVNFRQNQTIEIATNNSVDTFSFKTKGDYKRQYAILYSENYSFINVGIKEDGGTRTVFTGAVYDINQFLLIDQLAK